MLFDMTVDITSSITSIYCSNYSCIVRFVTVIVNGVLIYLINVSGIFTGFL